MPDDIAIKVFLKQKWKWTTETWNDICWDTFKKLGDIAYSRKSFIQKVKCGWVNTGKQTQLQYQHTPTCQSCESTDEDIKHIFECPKNNTAEMQTKCCKALAKIKTDPRIINTFKHMIFQDMEIHNPPPNVTAAIVAQQKIGIPHLMIGVMSTKWRELQAEYNHHNPTTVDITKWSIKMGQILQHFAYGIWQRRNHYLHDEDNIDAPT